MKFITVSGIDKSGKTTIINALMEETFYRNFVVDRDPSNFYSLSKIQNNRGIDEEYKKRYKKFKSIFSKSVDIAVFLYCDIDKLNERFKKTNEPDIVGELSLKDHQELLLKSFINFGYKKNIIVNTTDSTIDQCVEEILIELYKLSYQQKINYGDINRMKCGCNSKVISYINKSKIEILFDSGYKTIAKSTNITTGFVKDKLCPTVLKVGTIGVGKHKESSHSYKSWYAMMRRTYTIEGDFECDRTISKEWHNYQIFSEWYDKNYIPGYYLDKDLLIYGNKHYSKETCIFIPSEVNTFCIHNRNNKRENFHLPIGVIVFGNGYSSAIGMKIRYTVKEAMNDYWNEKYIRTLVIAKKYNDIENHILSFFENLFIENYIED